MKAFNSLITLVSLIVKKKKNKMDSRPEENNSFQFNKLRHMHVDVNTASIVVDASKYIKMLKERVEKLNKEVAVLQSSNDQKKSLPSVKVETLEKGFRIKVFSEKTCPGLLVAVLEAFEELGLEVLDATVSCAHNFSLEAISEGEGQFDDNIDAQVVKQAVLQAIRSWNQNSEQE
ncbi:transcription factor bHLH93-like isoform X1 [Primulina tabacum]|uniref:transcription factor bHLH93-like isoform X1 n=1 Tax=Primulina tabacum TaxID=48773 RepID=UPI003F59FAF4